MENENQNKINENNLESISDFNIAFGPDNSVSNTEEEIEVLPDFNNTNLSNPSIVQEDNQNLSNNLENNQEQSSVETLEENQVPQSINTNLETQNNNEITFQDNNSQNASTNEVSISNNLNMDISNKNQDDDLLKSFIGNNYEKITTKKFNFAGLFFGALYMFYRKMYIYALLIYIINFIILKIIKLPILNLIINLIINILIGLFINTLYIKFANQKINKIKNKNNTKSNEEIKSICIQKGGTSVGYIFLGFISEILLSIFLSVIMMLFGLSTNLSKIIKIPKLSDPNVSIEKKNDSKLVEDIEINGYLCSESNCSITVDENNNDVEYKLKTNNNTLLVALKDYEDYVKINIYYVEQDNNKYVVDYKIYSKLTNEEISNEIDENKLRDTLGIYSEGKHTDTLTLVKKGSLGVGYKNGESYSYITYTFKNKLNNEVEIQEKNPANINHLIEGNNYNVTFEVQKGTFDYEFYIIKIEQ